MEKYAIGSFQITLLCLLSILNTHNLKAQITSYPYIEDFESGPAGWTVKGATTSWELGIPADYIIDYYPNPPLAVYGKNVWATNLNGNYDNNEYGWVQSPIFDLSTLKTPYIQFAIWYDFSDDDGVTIESSVDSGTTWQTLFNSGNPPSGEIINWMDSTVGSLSNTIGWSEYSDGWETMIYPLESLSGAKNVIFRILFGSNADDYSTSEGIAFDYFQIYDTSCYAGNDIKFEEDLVVDNGSSINLNAYYATNSGNANSTSGKWRFKDGPIGPRGPWLVSIAGSGGDEADFPNTGAGLTEYYTFDYIVGDSECQDTAEIKIPLLGNYISGDESEIIYICADELIASPNELFNVFILDRVRTINNEWLVYNGNESFDLDSAIFPVGHGKYSYSDGTLNELHAEVQLIDCSDESVNFSFSNAQITNDGTNSYYEVDVMIQTNNPGSSLKLGNGKLFFQYNPAAFGKYVNAYNNIEITYPHSNGYIAGQPIDSDPNTAMYSGSRILDNANNPSINRFSWTFTQKNNGSSIGIAADNVTNTPRKLCHLKLKYLDVNQDPMLAFETNGIYDNKFNTAFSPSIKPTLIVNDTFDNKGATLSTSDTDMFRDITLSPNPTRDILYVKGNTVALNSVEVYSVSGRKVMSLIDNLDVINLSSLDSGMYFLKLNVENATKTFKIIKK